MPNEPGVDDELNKSRWRRRNPSNKQASASQLPYSTVRPAGPILSGGGFLLDASSSDPLSSSQQQPIDASQQQRLRRGKRKLDEDNQPIIDLVPCPPDVDRPECDTCGRHFDESKLRWQFDVNVCDRCHDPSGTHGLITKSRAKELYLLTDIDLDVREPKLRYILKRNPHNPAWGDMRLYLEAQVVERAVSKWGSEKELEAERQRRTRQAKSNKLKRYCKQINELKLRTRSSLYVQTHDNHEHVFSPEVYDPATGFHVKLCTLCQHKVEFEKL